MLYAIRHTHYTTYPAFEFKWRRDTLDQPSWLRESNFGLAFHFVRLQNNWLVLVMLSSILEAFRNLTTLMTAADLCSHGLSIGLALCSTRVKVDSSRVSFKFRNRVLQEDDTCDSLQMGPQELSSQAVHQIWVRLLVFHHAPGHNYCNRRPQRWCLKDSRILSGAASPWHVIRICVFLVSQTY